MSTVKVSVSDLDIFREWQDDDEQDLPTLLKRLYVREETEQMRAGLAFHAALEEAERWMDTGEDEVGAIAHGDYRFDFNCQCDLSLPHVREIPVSKQYGDLLVRGRIDGMQGRTIVDYKTTGIKNSSPKEAKDEELSETKPEYKYTMLEERLWEGYQWRFYLDMTGADTFEWMVFVMREFGSGGSYQDEMHAYEVREVYTLRQQRYPDLEKDCAKLAADYLTLSRSLEATGQLLHTGRG